MANPTTSPRGKEENHTNPTLDKAKDVASQVMDKAREGASAVGERVGQAASSVGKQADHLAASAGSSIKNLGDTLSQNAPREGMLGTASQAVANTLKDSGKYLEESGVSGIADDMTELIRRNPVPAVLVGMGIGFLLGRVLRS